MTMSLLSRATAITRNRESAAEPAPKNAFRTDSVMLSEPLKKLLR